MKRSGDGRAPVLRIARVQMHDRRAGFRRVDRRLGDLPAVTGRRGDIDGVWTEPVTAQVMMTLFFDATVTPCHRDANEPCAKVRFRGNAEFAREFGRTPGAPDGLGPLDANRRRSP